MTFDIRQALPTDAEALGHVHYTAWLETYSGLINTEYLGLLSPGDSAKGIQEHLENVLVLIADNQTIGFSITGPTRSEDLPDSFGDIHDIYILKEFQNQGLGKRLLDAAISKLNAEGYAHTAMWILGTNNAAIRFFEMQGFEADGTELEMSYVTPVLFKRLVRINN